MRKFVIFLGMVFILVLICIPQLLHMSLTINNQSKSFDAKNEDKTSIKNNNTISPLMKELQGKPVRISDHINKTSNTEMQKQFMKEDFAALEVGKSTIDDLLLIIENYPAMATSYGSLYQIELETGEKLSICLDNNGIITRITYS